MPRRKNDQQTSKEAVEVQLYERPVTRKRKINFSYLADDNEGDDNVQQKDCDKNFKVPKSKKLNTRQKVDSKPSTSKKENEIIKTDTVDEQQSKEVIPSSSQEDENALKEETINFWDLESYDVLPDIWRHLKLSDLLNLSLVSKTMNDLVSPEIIRCSKIVFKARGLSRRETLEIKSFTRLYNEIELESSSKKHAIDLIKDLMEFNMFKLQTVGITIDNFLHEKTFLKKLKKIGGFDKFAFTYGNTSKEKEPEEFHEYINQITTFDTRHVEKLNEFSKISKNLNIRELLLQYNYGSGELDIISLPKLRTLRIVSSSNVTPYIRSILAGGANQLTTLTLNDYSNGPVIQEILEANCGTLKTIEIRVSPFLDFNILPAQPKVLRVTISSSNQAAIIMSRLLKGQTNLEELYVQFPRIDGSFLDILLVNPRLTNLTINRCDVYERNLSPQHIPIFTRLRNFTYKGNAGFFDMFVKHLVNVSTFSVESYKKSENPKYNKNVELPNLKYLILKGPGRGLLPLFKNSIALPLLKELDIQYSKKVFIDVHTLGAFKSDVKVLKIRNWLYSYQVDKVLKDFRDLESLTLKTTDVNGILPIMENIFKMERKIPYINVTVYDWNRQFLSLKQAFVQICPDVTVTGDIRGTCISLEIFFEDPVVIHIEKSIRKYSVEEI
ncbi:hypothetical protein ACFFRR_010623 [Megaselia abdita]